MEERDKKKEKKTGNSLTLLNFSNHSKSPRRSFLAEIRPHYQTRKFERLILLEQYVVSFFFDKPKIALCDK